MKLLGKGLQKKEKSESKATIFMEEEKKSTILQLIDRCEG